jgi:hypothetical protein
MNWCYAFSRRRFIWCPPRQLAIEDLLTQLLRRYTPTVRQIIRCWRTCRQSVSLGLFVTVGWTIAPPSVHPVLKLQSWHVSVLIQMRRRIDRRCPHLDRRIIQCYWLCCFSAIHLVHLGIRSSDHPTMTSSFWLSAQCTNYTDASSYVPSIHLTVPFFFFSFCIFNLTLLQLNILNIPSLIVPKYILSPFFFYK